MMNEMERAQSSRKSGKVMKYGMWACCAAMLVPVAGYFAIGGISGGVINNAILLAPLLLCVGVHLLMHRFMGKSCHGSAGDKDATTVATSVQIGREIASK